MDLPLYSTIHTDSVLTSYTFKCDVQSIARERSLLVDRPGAALQGHLERMAPVPRLAAARAALSAADADATAAPAATSGRALHAAAAACATPAAAMTSLLAAPPELCCSIDELQLMHCILVEYAR